MVAQGHFVRYNLLAGAYSQAAQVGGAAVAVDVDYIFVGADSAVEVCAAHRQLGVRCLLGNELPAAACGRGGFLDIVDFDMRALGCVDVYHL